MLKQEEAVVVATPRFQLLLVMLEMVIQISIFYATSPVHVSTMTHSHCCYDVVDISEPNAMTLPNYLFVFHVLSVHDKSVNASASEILTLTSPAILIP